MDTQADLLYDFDIDFRRVLFARSTRFRCAILLAQFAQHL